ncbi:hypothetical protein ACQP04_21890 [Pseudonocardia halophobica]|uniref:hypothetical protein n=1 Tax=Pseudonocardia halophobica TaxID=29401 RepID=UPI003D8B2F90
MSYAVVGPPSWPGWGSRSSRRRTAAIDREVAAQLGYVNASCSSSYFAPALLAALLAWPPPSGAIYGPFVPFDDAAVAPFYALLDDVDG